MASLLLALIYVCFVSLGLPDSLLGSAWPVMHADINVPVSYAGIISMTTFIGTIASSLLSNRLLIKFGAGKVTAVSVATTAIALLGFSFSGKFWMLLLWSIPYGLGAGGVDSILNNYVALNFKAQHMSWLHCMWGVGATISPYIMSFSLVKYDGWNNGYLIVSIIQIVLSAIIIASIPLWKKGKNSELEKSTVKDSKPMTFKEILSTKGAVACFIAFFSYCALEVTASLWAASYLVEKWEFSPGAAAGFVSMFYIGITAGRFVNGFLAMKLNDHFLIRLGLAIIGLGIALLLVPHPYLALVGFLVIGVGCAPIYPCIIHMTPFVFGEEKSQAMIGVQLAFAYTGFIIMPSIFGYIADKISISLLSIYLLVFLVVMVITHERVARKNKTKE